MTAHDSAAMGTAALDAGRWSDAKAAFDVALRSTQTADVLSGMGQALWWLGETERSVEFYERAYASFRRTGDSGQAIWTALWLGLTYGSDFGNGAAFNGWVSRAERLVEQAEASPMKGWVWLVRAYDTRSLELIERVLELARDSGDFDLELCALAHLGELLVSMAYIDEGLALIDEAMAGTFGGERSRFDTVVFTSCSMLVACETAADIERAVQWCQVADSFIQEYGCPFLHARCRTGYGSILAATGRWDEAEQELEKALQFTQARYPPIYAVACARLADLRLNQGRLEEAEALLSGIDDPSGAVPLARCHLSRGEAGTAAALLQRRLRLLGEHCIEMASTLDLLVECQLAVGDLESAAGTLERLQALAVEHGRDLVTARAASAYAKVLVRRGMIDAGIEQFEKALAHFSRLHLPFETAQTRLELARALASGHPEIAIVEARNALDALTRLGASTQGDEAAALLRSFGAPARNFPRDADVLSHREREVLQLIGLGLSNPEIAERLVISRKTAAHHVSSVLDKLGLRNRAQAVAYVTRNNNTKSR